MSMRSLATSSNGVRALLNREPDLSIPLFAVGDATAMFLDECDVSLHVVDRAGRQLDEACAFKVLLEVVVLDDLPPCRVVGEADHDMGVGVQGIGRAVAADRSIGDQRVDLSS